MAQPAEPLYPSEAQRAGGGVCYKQTISPTKGRAKGKRRRKAKTDTGEDDHPSLHQALTAIRDRLTDSTELLLAWEIAIHIMAAYAASDGKDNRQRLKAVTICSELNISYHTLTRTLPALKRAGIITVKRTGRAPYYSFTPEFWEHLKRSAAEGKEYRDSGHSQNGNIRHSQNGYIGDQSPATSEPITVDPFPPMNLDGPMTKRKHEAGEAAMKELMAIDAKKENAR